MSIPFAVGDVLSGPAPFDVYLDEGNRATDPVVATGVNRTLTVIPEPSSLALGGLAVGLILIARRARRVVST